MKKLTKRLVLMLSIYLVFIFSTFALASNDRFELSVTNSSELDYPYGIFAIDIPENYNDRFVEVYDKKGSLVPSHLSNNGKHLYVQSELKAKQEALFSISFKNKAGSKNYLNPSSDPGTHYCFINYDKAYIISSEADNKILIQGKNRELLDELTLQKGEMHLVTTQSPQTMRIEAQAPVFVYISSINAGKNLSSPYEEGDSDTTSLFGSNLHLYTEHHLWVSSYEETKASLYDQSGFPVWEELLSANSGVKLPDMPAGTYFLQSDKPVTAQFGYLDDENFSYIHGKSNQTNAFSFGDLLITALHPDTVVELSYFNPKKQQRKVQLKHPGSFELISMVELFSPKEPEYVFFTLSYSKPVLINTFSSGTNFGGAYVPGFNGIYTDTVFRYLTPRISQEFSKEQKNMIQLLGLFKETSITITDTIQRNVVLQENTPHYEKSNESLVWIQLEGDEAFLLAQLHNYPQKGLFAWVPPLQNKTIQAFIGGPFIDAVSPVSNKFSFTDLLDSYRFKEFISHVGNKEYLPFTIFFLTFLLSIIFFLILLLLHHKTKKKNLIEANETEDPNEDVETTELMSIMQDMEKKMNENIESSIPVEPPPPDEMEKAAIKDTPFVYPKLRIYNDPVAPLDKPQEIPTQQDEPQSQVVEKKFSDLNVELPFLDVDHTRESNQVALINNEQSKIATFFNKKVALDPGSANRLFFEGQLQHFTQAFMVKSSAKRLQTAVSCHLKQIDLSMQDISRAQLFQDRLETLEEAGKALALCKKKRLSIYITSYRLPAFIQKIQIIHISELLREN